MKYESVYLSKDFAYLESRLMALFKEIRENRVRAIELRQTEEFIKFLNQETRPLKLPPKPPAFPVPEDEEI